MKFKFILWGIALTLSIFSGFLFYGCSNFEDINTNPDATTEGDASMLLTGVELSFLPGNEKGFVLPFLAQKELVWTEGSAADYQYNVFGRAGFSDYVTLENVNKMELAAVNSGSNETTFSAIGKFIKCYQLFYLSSYVGDIPYSEALGGEEGNYTPSYDSQKQVMLSVLNELKEAEALFNEAEENNEQIDGDIFYDGEPSQWRKLVNTFYLNVLLNLSKKADDPDLKIITRFNEVLDNPDQYPIFTSNGDNFQVVYSNQEGSYKPFYNNGLVQYAVVSSFVTDKLKELEDYRLFYYADPVSGKSQNEFDSYRGLDPSASNQSNLEIYASQQISIVNGIYYDEASPAGIPYVILGYQDLQFILAEAAARGWIDKDPDPYYKAGIQASFQFRKDNTPGSYVHGMPITASYIEEYLLNAKIQLSDNREAQIEQILWQKYIASFLQNDWNVYLDYRRTGYPEFPINPETNKNSVSDKIPVRWMYPQNEYDHNLENVGNAVQRQYNGNDDTNELMWMIK